MSVWCQSMSSELLFYSASKLWYWRRLLRVPWTAGTSNQSILKEIKPEYSLEGLMLKLKLWYFGHLMQRADSFEKTLMLGKTEGRWRRGWQRMRRLDGSTDSMDMLLLLSHFSRVQHCVTQWMAAHQAPPSLGFSRQEHEWVAISFSIAWKWKLKVKLLSRVQLSTTPWTTAYQAPLSMGFSRQEYWSGLPLPSPQWTWVWPNSRREWRTGKPGVLQSLGSQRVGHYLVTEQQQPVFGHFFSVLTSWERGGLKTFL